MPMYIDIHVLQTVPPSNLNRDDTGAPKSAMYGGVRRARVSSQAWKKAVRNDYATYLDDAQRGVRTKRAVELLVERIVATNPELDEAEAATRAEGVLKALGITAKRVVSKTQQKAIDAGEAEDPKATTDYLIFWSNRQLDRLAELAVRTDKPSKAEAKAAADQEHGIDVALFGRMVADAADINVDAAVQVAHALGTHATTPEQDYFTAVDDQNPEEETGAGMIGTVEFNAATLYRYATVNVEGLRANLGNDDVLVTAVEAFVRSFVRSMPTGKQNTFANRTLPDAVVVCVRHDQPVNLVGAFENPIQSDNGYIAGSARALAEHYATVTSFASPAASVMVARSTAAAAAVDALATPVPLDDLVAYVADAVRSSGAGTA